MVQASTLVVVFVAAQAATTLAAPALVLKERDFAELEERGLGGLFKGIAKGVGRIFGGGASSQQQPQQRDLEAVELDIRELDLSQLDARAIAELEERGFGGIFKGIAKGVGKLFGGGGSSQQQQQRRDFEDIELDLRDLDLSEFDARDIAALEERRLGGLIKGIGKGIGKVGKVLGGALGGGAPAPQQQQPQQQQPQQRDLEAVELDIRELSEMEERGLGGLFKIGAKVAGKVLGGASSIAGSQQQQRRDVEDELVTRELEQIADLDARGLGGLFKVAAKGAGKLFGALGGGGSSQQQQQRREEFVIGGFLSQRDLEDLVGRDLEGITARDLENIDARDIAYLEERGLGGLFKIGAKAVGKLFGGGGSSQQQQQRREVEVFDLRDIHEIDVREIEEISARDPLFGGLLKAGAKVAGKIFGGGASQQQQQRREIASLEDLD